MSYKVKLDVFEGPLDLLLYLIKKEELDICDIPIAKITDQYLEYLEYLKLLDLNIAGEFIVMAATLMQIKSKMLLPPEQGEEEQLEADPRAELVKRLLEYKKFKEAAQELSLMKNVQRDFFGRGMGGKPPVIKEREEFFEVHLFDLITAFSKILRDIPKDVFHQFVKDEFTVSEKIHEIFHILVEKQVIYFTDLFKKAKSKVEIIVIFLAILELIRLNEIIIFQKCHFGEIEITRNTESIRPA